MAGDLDHNTVHKLRAMLNGESEAHRDEARRLLNLVTDNRSVIELMGSAPACAQNGCQFRVARDDTPNPNTTLLLTNLADEDYDRITTARIAYSGATGKSMTAGYDDIGPYIASFVSQLPRVVAALGKPVQIEPHGDDYRLWVVEPDDPALDAARDILDRAICECGHTEGEHSGHRPGPGDPPDGPCGNCDCKRFTAVVFSVQRANEVKA